MESKKRKLWNAQSLMKKTTCRKIKKMLTQSHFTYNFIGSHCTYGFTKYSCTFFFSINHYKLYNMSKLYFKVIKSNSQNFLKNKVIHKISKINQTKKLWVIK